MTNEQAKTFFAWIGVLTCALAVIGCIAGCMEQPRRIQIAESAFTNQTAVAKSTYTSSYQYIVRCSDGSIWEVEVNDAGFLKYKNCLFDATGKPTVAQPTLERP